VKSYVVSQNAVGGKYRPDRPKTRIFQEGAQKIIGFDFRASLTMDMTADSDDDKRAIKGKKLFFTLAESSMFSVFDGSWSVRVHSRSKQIDPVTNEPVHRYKTILTYSVVVQPKGPVPVIALEWRIKEDVPINLLAMKVASEKLTASRLAQAQAQSQSQSLQGGAYNEVVMEGTPVSGPTASASVGLGAGIGVSVSESASAWESDETLAVYIPSRDDNRNRNNNNAGVGSGGAGRSSSGRGLPLSTVTGTSSSSSSSSVRDAAVDSLFQLYSSLRDLRIGISGGNGNGNGNGNGGRGRGGGGSGGGVRGSGDARIRTSSSQGLSTGRVRNVGSKNMNNTVRRGPGAR
jgi:hypothetical protein